MGSKRDLILRADTVYKNGRVERGTVNLKRAVMIGVLLAAGATGLVSCKHATGPSLSAVLESQSLSPTMPGDTTGARCCCRVTGTVRNTSSVGAHISLRFRANDRSGKDIGTAVDLVANVKPGEARPYDAAGILVPCSQVGKTEPDVLVIGLYHPDPEM